MDIRVDEPQLPRDESLSVPVCPRHTLVLTFISTYNIQSLKITIYQPTYREVFAFALVHSADSPVGVKQRIIGDLWRMTPSYMEDIQ
jgi:zona occludens toxin (predicted ATPase)